jgi:hypothetical protein
VLIGLAVWLAVLASRSASAQSVTSKATSTAGWQVTGTAKGWTVGNVGVALNQFQVSAQGYTIRNPLAQQNIAESYSPLAVKDNPAGRSTSTGKLNFKAPYTGGYIQADGTSVGTRGIFRVTFDPKLVAIAKPDAANTFAECKATWYDPLQLTASGKTSDSFKESIGMTKGTQLEKFDPSFMTTAPTLEMAGRFSFGRALADPTQLWPSSPTLSGGAPSGTGNTFDITISTNSQGQVTSVVNLFQLPSSSGFTDSFGPGVTAGQIESLIDHANWKQEGGMLVLDSNLNLLSETLSNSVAAAPSAVSLGLATRNDVQTLSTPEPASLVLTTTAGICLLAYATWARWRRRIPRRPVGPCPVVAARSP